MCLSCPRNKSVPRFQGVAWIFEAQRPREVVSTASRHHQQRQLQFDQLAKMPVNGSIAAKEEHGIGPVRSFRKANRPLYSGIYLERSKIFLRRSPSQDGGDAHAWHLTTRGAPSHSHLCEPSPSFVLRCANMESGDLRRGKTPSWRLDRIQGEEAAYVCHQAGSTHRIPRRSIV